MLISTMLGLAAASSVARAQVTFAGTQITIAGPGLAGEDGLQPTGVALDGKGNVFLIDQASNSIVEIPNNASGFGAPVTLLSGLSSPGALAADWSGNLFVADTGNNRIVMLAVVSGVYGPAVPIASGLNSPAAVAVDAADNVFVADTGNNRIVEFLRVGGGYGSPVVACSGFNAPMGIAVDAAETLYVADTDNNRVVKIPYSAAGYTTQTIAARNVWMPRGLAVDKLLNLFIADTGNSRIVEYPWNAGAKRYNSPSISGSDFATPVAVAVDTNGDLYVADGAKNRLQEVVTSSMRFPAAAVNTSASTQTFNFMVNASVSVGGIAVYMQGAGGADFADAGTGSCAAQTYSAATPCGVEVSFTPHGSGLRMGAVVLYDPSGNALATAYISGTGPAAQVGFLPGTMTSLGAQLSGPSGVAVDGSGNVYIADTGNNRVVELPWSNGSYGAQVTLPVTGLSNPMGMNVDGAGNLFIVSNGNDKVLKLPWLGNAFGPQIKIGTGLYGPSGVAVDAVGNVYITDTLDSALDKLAWTGNAYGSSQNIGNYRKFPVGITMDPAGNVFFAMPYQNWLVKIPWTGSQFLPEVTIPVNGSSFPSAIAMDGNSNLYVVDSGNNRVVMLAWNGTGFESPVLVAGGLNAPSAIAIDGSGNLYIADTGNNQIVKIDLSTPGKMSFDDTYLGSTSADSMQVAQVESIGNLPLSIDSVHYPIDFPEDTASARPCASGVILAPGGVCQLGVDFTPSVAGTLQDTVAVTANTGASEIVTGTLAVNGNSLSRQSQSIAFPPVADQTYGDPSIPLAATASSGLPVTYQVVSGPATISGSGEILHMTGVGTIVVQADQAGNSTYGPAVSVATTFHVKPAVLQVIPANTEVTYGSVPSSFSYAISGFVLGQSAGNVVSGRAVVSASVSGNPAAGSYTLTASQGTLSAANYTFQFSSAKLTVDKATLQIRVVSQYAVYASATPQMNWSASGFVNGDTMASIHGAPQITIPSAAMNAVGSYSILPAIGTLSAANYNFSFVAGSLKVTPAVLTTTANSQSMVYGAAVPTLTCAISGLLHGDIAGLAISGTPAIVTTANSRSAVGTYPITISGGSMQAANYTFKFVPGTLMVSKAVLTITPVSAVMTYGGKVPSLSYTIGGFLPGDTTATAVSGAASMTTQATSHSKPGVYSTTASVGWLVSKNYSFAFATGTLTVNKALLTVTPAASTSAYGSNPPACTSLYSGFVNGDGVGSIQGLPLWTTTATAKSPVGTYSVTGTQGTLASEFYTFSMGSGSLTIGKAVLTVQPAAASMVYGGALPALSYTFTGFMNGDTANVVSGQATVSTSVTGKSPVGSYVTSVSIGSLSAKNYSFVANYGKLSVIKAVLTLTPASVSMVYGGTTPALSYTVTGLLNGDAASVVTGNTWYTGLATKKSSVGTYAYTMSPGTLTAANYSLIFAPGTETVTPAVLTVTATNQSMTYGASLPAFTYSISGFVGEDTAKSATAGVPAFNSPASAGAPVGQYTVGVSAGTLAAANYSFQYQAGTLTVNKAALTITAANLTAKAGSAIPALTYTVSGFAHGDTAQASVQGVPVLSTTATTTSKSGTYPIAVALGSLSATNYTFTLVNGTLTLQ